MKRRYVPLIVALMGTASLTVANPAHAVIDDGITVSASAPGIDVRSRTVMIAVRGLPATANVLVRVTGPRDLDQTFEVSGESDLVYLTVTLPGSYRLSFPDVQARGWYYPSHYSRAFTVPLTASQQRVTVTYAKAQLRFDGIGKLYLGMTLDQAKRVDPNVKTMLEFGCVQATSRYADLFFNSPADGGKLALILARPGITTPAGIKIGDSYRKAKRAYRFTRRTLDSRTWDYIRVAPNYAARRGREATKTPLLGVEFETGPDKNSREFWITRSTISSLFIDGGQKCVSP